MISEPVFNLPCGIWTGGPPLAKPSDCAAMPDVDSIPTQKYYPNRVFEPGAISAWWYGALSCEFRFPTELGDLLGDIAYWNILYIQCPVGSADWWRAMYWDWRHQGFPNQYAFVTCDRWTYDGNLWVPPLLQYQAFPYTSFPYPRP